MSLTSISNVESLSDHAVDRTIKTNEDTNTKQPTNSKPKGRARFTRGEKCLFLHLVVTFVLLLVLFIIYIVHLSIVKHHGDEMFAGWLRTGAVPAEKQPSLPIGKVYVLPNSVMCNSLLLRPKWSLAPAHCVAARSDPDLYYALPNWRIVYGTNENRDAGGAEQYLETRIKRSVPHPHFNRDDFQNNIGLFEHADPTDLYSYVSLSDVSLNEKMLVDNAADLKLIGWEHSWHLHGNVTQNPVLPLTLEKCKLYVTPIVDLREYEYCVAPKIKGNVSITPGAILATESQYLGLYSWGESTGRSVPYVVLDLATYKNWIEHIIFI